MPPQDRDRSNDSLQLDSLGQQPGQRREHRSVRPDNRGRRTWRRNTATSCRSTKSPRSSTVRYGPGARTKPSPAGKRDRAVEPPRPAIMPDGHHSAHRRSRPWMTSSAPTRSVDTVRGRLLVARINAYLLRWVRNKYRRLQDARRHKRHGSESSTDIVGSSPTAPGSTCPPLPDDQDEEPGNGSRRVETPSGHPTGSDRAVLTDLAEVATRRWARPVRREPGSAGQRSAAGRPRRCRACRASR